MILMLKCIYTCLACIFSVCISFADEQTYNGLVKREIKEKLIRAKKVIESKQLDKHRTFSIIVDDQLVYCHYEHPRKKSLPLIICY